MNTKTENNNSANNSVFLDNLFTLCSRRKVEAKDALNGAGINSGYIERWQNGEAVTYEMLGLLSIYFHIPVDYFFELSVNEKLLGNSVERTPNKPFEFLYETLLALCGDKRAKTEYKQIVVMSFIDFTITPYDVEQLLLASQNKKDFTPSQKLAAYYILSLVYKPAIPKGLVDEYEKEIELLNKMGCKDIVSWLNPLTDFRFDNNHIRKTIRCVINAADVKNCWISFIRFHEHNVREISDLCVADYIEFYCPAVNNILNHLKIHYQTVDNEDWDELINGLFGVDATVYGVCQKHNISVS